MEQLDERPPREAWQVAWALTQQTGGEASSLHGSQQGAISSEIQPAVEQATGATLSDAPSSGHATAHKPQVPQEELVHAAQHQASTSYTATGLRQSYLPAWPLHVLRSSQMDAQRLDAELLTLLREQLQHSLALFQPGRVADWEPELHALLRMLVFGMSVLRGGATPGSQLLNLRYRSEPPISWHPPGSTRCSHTSTPPLALLQRPSQQSSKGPSSAQPSSSGPGLVHHGPTRGTVSGGLPLGGRTGVEGPGLSIGQRILLGVGLVVVPYLWARLGTHLARISSSNDVVTWTDLHAQASGNSGEGTGSRTSQAHRQAQQAEGVEEQGQGAAALSLQKSQPRGILGLLYTLLLQRPHRLALFIVRALKQLASRLQRSVFPTAAKISGVRADRQSRYDALWRGMRFVEGVYRAATVVNFLVFLSGGRYRSVLERLVGARLVYMQPVMTRIISFEYLNRQLVWQEVSELLLFLLPMLDAARARRSLNRFLPRLPDPRRLLRNVLGEGPSPTSTESATAEGTAEDSSGISTGKPSAKAGSSGGGAAVTAAKRPEGPCPVCGSTDILTPVVAVPCGHCFCYYCLASNSAHDSHYQCPCDGVRVAAMERWRPGIKVTSV